MKATEAKLLDFLKRSPQFAIPIYQRTYSWTERECRQLWDDIIRTGTRDDVAAHFIGSVVYIEQGLYQVSTQSQVLVIDGQQRLTSIMLILEALARRLGDTEPVDGFSARKIRSYYLLNPLEEGEKAFKLLLTQTDRDSLVAILEQRALPAEHSDRIAANFEFYTQQIEALGDPVPLCRGLAKLVMVDIALARGQDNPQLIFESMNSTGRELSQADLIRNFILMGLEPAQQDRLYRNHWRPMELAFGQEGYGTHFDAFMRHYLTVKSGEIPKIHEVYAEFKVHARSPEVAARGVEALVAEIHAVAAHYCAMALDREADPQLAAAFRDLREFKVEVAYPFLLVLYEDHAAGVLSKEHFLAAIRLVESYVFRRAVCAIPTNSMNKTFAGLPRMLRKDRYLESIVGNLLALPSYRRFPGDDEFKRELATRDLYNFPRRSYWLRRLENHDRKERVRVDDYTIEHIMPQNPDLPAAWRAALGEEWERVHQTWLHTLGNLTLTGYNAEYSDRPFAEKRDMEGGFAASPLQLNKGIGRLEAWNEQTIRDRADRLAEWATRVWSMPTLPEEVLATYRPTREQRATYTIEDHPYLRTESTLHGGIARQLFDAFRREALAIDPCVVEEVRKIYVAYKAETNFVDVIPQAKRLLLSLNIPLPELDDPRGGARDVSNLGRWGNGRVEVPLSTLEELPYAMSLVRQAFERQMGSGDGEP